MVIYLERDADLHLAQLMPLPLTVSCFSKIQIGLTVLVPAHPGSPGQRAVKCVCVCVCVCKSTIDIDTDTDPTGPDRTKVCGHNGSPTKSGRVRQVEFGLKAATDKKVKV